jgi:hypothetical protein
MSSTDNLDALLCGRQSNWSRLPRGLAHRRRQGWFPGPPTQVPDLSVLRRSDAPVHRCGRPGGGEPPRRSHSAKPQQALPALAHQQRLICKARTPDRRHPGVVRQGLASAVRRRNGIHLPHWIRRSTLHATRSRHGQWPVQGPHRLHLCARALLANRSRRPVPGRLL